MCPGSSQQRDFAALFRYRRCISSSGGIFRFKAVCVVMCSGGGQQRDFAALFRCRRCISTLVGIFRFKRGFVSLCVRAAVSSAISPLCSVTDGALLPRAASSGLNAAWGVICPGGGQQRDFAALFRCRRCASSSGGIFRFKHGLGRYMSERLLHFCRLRMPLTRRSCCLRPFADPWPTFWPQCRPNLQAK